MVRFYFEGTNFDQDCKKMLSDFNFEQVCTRKEEFFSLYSGKICMFKKTTQIFVFLTKETFYPSNI